MFRPWGLLRTLPMREKDYCFLFFSLQKTEMNSWRASCHPVSFGLCWKKLSLMSANLTVGSCCARRKPALLTDTQSLKHQKKQHYCRAVLFCPSGGCVAVNLRGQLSLTSHPFCDVLLYLSEQAIAQYRCCHCWSISVDDSQAALHNGEMKCGLLVRMAARQSERGERKWAPFPSLFRSLSVRIFCT